MNSDPVLGSRIRRGALGLLPLALGAGVALAATTEAPIEDQLKSLRCHTEATRLLDEWAPARHWLRAANALDGSRIYRTPTEQVGRWVELRILPDQTLEAIRLTTNTATRVKWDAASCLPRLGVKTAAYDAEKMKKAFTDEELESTLKRAPAGLIYAWSPHMVYSVKGYEAARKAAKKMGVAFVPVLDPVADWKSSVDVAGRAGIEKSAMRRIASMDLVFRGLTIHYPAALVFSQGKITSGVMPGLESRRGYETFIQENVSR